MVLLGWLIILHINHMGTMNSKEVNSMSGKYDYFRREYEFKNVNLSTVDSVLGLIMLRSKLDIYMDYGFAGSVLSACNWKDVNQELIALYADLDILKEQCNFDDQDKMLIKGLEMGYTESDLADAFQKDPRWVKSRIRNIARRICQQNLDNWVIWAYLNYIKTEWKTCRICGKSYPLIERFFHKSETTKDGYRTECKECFQKMING